MALRDSSEINSKLSSAMSRRRSSIDSDTSDELPDLVPDVPIETLPETSTTPQRLASRLSFWSLLKKNKKKNRHSRDSTRHDSCPSPPESSDEGSSDNTGSKGGFWSSVKKHLMKSPEPSETNINGAVHDPIPSAPDPETLLGATALPLSPASTSSLDMEHNMVGLEDCSEMTDDIFESHNRAPRHNRRRSSISDPIQLGLDIAQEFLTPITPPRHISGPFGSPFSSPLDSTSSPFNPSFGSRSREFGTAFSSGSRPSPFDILLPLSQVLRSHLENASQNNSREPDSDSSPLSESPASLPELIPNSRPGEIDSSSDDTTYVPLLPHLSDSDSEPPQLLDEAIISPPDLTNSNMESSMAVPLLPGLIYIVVSVDDASLAGLHLLSQLDNSGPPPLSEAKIEQIPTKIITKEQCDNGLQCSICMEEFCIQQSVRVLCCEHCFHNDCIRPWLELHGTCPVCRKTLSSPEEEAAASELQNSTNNILNGASLGARLSGAVSVSSSSASSSSSLSTASSDGTRQRPTITMFII